KAANQCSSDGSATSRNTTRENHERGQNFSSATRCGRRAQLPPKLVDLPSHTPSLWLAFLGLHHRWRNSGKRHREFLATTRLRSDSRLWHDGDRFAHQPLSSVSHAARIDWQGCSRTGVEAG